MRNAYREGLATRIEEVAETEGFEPSVRFPVRRFSKALVSATHPRLRAWRNGAYSEVREGDQQAAAGKYSFALPHHRVDPPRHSLPRKPTIRYGTVKPGVPRG